MRHLLELQSYLLTCVQSHGLQVKICPCAVLLLLPCCFAAAVLHCDRACWLQRACPAAGRHICSSASCLSL